MKLTVKERILIAAFLDRELVDNGVTAPAGLCARGLAATIDVTRAHVCADAKKLIETGSVRTELRHVDGYDSRHKCYLLTPQGEAEASRLIKELGGKDLAKEALKVMTHQPRKTLDDIGCQIRSLKEQISTLELAFMKIKGAN